MWCRSLLHDGGDVEDDDDDGDDDDVEGDEETIANVNMTAQSPTPVSFMSR